MEEKIIGVLRGMVRTYYTAEIISNMSGFSVEDINDCMFKLEQSDKIEISEWEDGLRFRLKSKELPLTPEQKQTVEKYRYLTVKLAANKKTKIVNEDLMQDLCCELIQTVKKFIQKEVPLEKYILYKLIRYRKSWYKRSLDYHWTGLGDNPSSTPKKTNIELEKVGSSRKNEVEVKDQISHAMSVLDHRQSQVFLLREYYGLSTPEIANSMKLTTAQVTYSYKSAKQALRERNVVACSNEIDYILPSIFIGEGSFWHRAKSRQTCQICKNKDLPVNGYCLRCDRWYFDQYLKLSVKKSHKKKSVTKKMLKRLSK